MKMINNYGLRKIAAPYNAYFPTNIAKLLDRNIPLSDWYNKKVPDPRPVMQVKVNDEPVGEVNNPDNINIDTNIINYNSTIYITDKQKEDWLWQEYFSKQQARREDVYW